MHKGVFVTLLMVSIAMFALGVELYQAGNIWADHVMIVALFTNLAVWIGAWSVAEDDKKESH